MGCLKLDPNYQKHTLKVVYRNPILKEKGVQRFLSVDPLTSSYPELTPYQFASNTPIQAVDLDGREAFHYIRTLDNNGNPFLTLVDVVDIVDHVVVGHEIVSKGGNDYGKPIYAEKVNQRQEHVVHSFYNTVGMTGITRNEKKKSFASLEEALNEPSATFDFSSGDKFAAWLSAAAELGTMNELVSGKNFLKLRHYTNSKGLKGIQETMEIQIKDKGRVHAESANSKPLSSVEAEAKYGLKDGRGRNYIEFEIDASKVEYYKNPDTGALEFRIKENVKLDPEKTTFNQRKK